MIGAKNRFRKAVGLSYENRRGADDAPQIAVKGEMFDADEVVRIARRYGVPVVENPELAQSLASFETDERIPRSLFEAVAIVLHQISRQLRR